MNIVKNNVTLEGSNELLKEIIRFLTRNGNVELDYNAIIPMPEELKQAEPLKIVDSAEEIVNFFA